MGKPQVSRAAFRLFTEFGQMFFQRPKRNRNVPLLRFVQWQLFAGIFLSKDVTGNIS